MIFDDLTKVAAAQQVTADAASGSAIDLGNITPKRAAGQGEPLALVVSITAIGTNTGSAFFQAVASAASALTTQKVRGAVGLDTADIAVGNIFVIPFGYHPTPLRYIGAYFDITGTVDFTVDAWVVPLKQAVDALPQSFARGYGFDIS